MKLKMKKMLMFVLTCFVIASFSQIVYADEYTEQLKGKFTDVENVGESDKISKVIKIVLSIIRNVGAGISLIMMILLGVKYMLASPQSKADYQKQAIPMLIGCVLLFSASELVGIIGDVAISTT